MIPVISIVGYSNSGKTTLLVKLLGELKNKGFRVATVKHHHGDFDIDIPGKDTWKHAQAGADTVVLAGAGKIAVIERTERKLTLDEILKRINGVDLIITEGFKKESKPKIEIFRPDIHAELVSPPGELLAVASDTKFAEYPTFSPDDAAGITEFLVKRLKLRSQNM